MGGIERRKLNAVKFLCLNKERLNPNLAFDTLHI